MEKERKELEKLIGEETRIIRRIGNYSTSQALQEDCIICHNALCGTILIDGICLSCYEKQLENDLGNKNGFDTEFEKGKYIAQKLIEHLKNSLAEACEIPIILNEEEYIVKAYLKKGEQK